MLSWVAFDGAEADRLLKRSGFEKDAPYRIGALCPEVRELLERVYAVLRTNRPNKISSDIELKSLLYKMFALFVEGSGEPEPDPLTGWEKACADYIELHATEGITVRQIARIAGFNHDYFSTVFAKAFGVPPAEYLTRVKMNRAKELLLGTTASITEIAYSLGYPSLFSFTRAFKNYVSLSPSDYRSKHKSR